MAEAQGEVQARVKPPANVEEKYHRLYFEAVRILVYGCGNRTQARDKVLPLVASAFPECLETGKR